MDRRTKFREGLSSLYLPYYDKLCGMLGPEWQPYMGLRSFDQQTALWNQGRSLPGHIVTNARGGESAHNYGCATDWVYFEGDTLTWLEKDDPKWKTYVDAITSVGLRPGLEFGDIDHNELKISCDWTEIHRIFDQQGMLAAQQKIEGAIE